MRFVLLMKVTQRPEYRLCIIKKRFYTVISDICDLPEAEDLP